MDNTYQSFNNATYEEVQEYLKTYGHDDNLNDTQNDSPSVQEFLDLYTEFPFITYIGYIVKKPREDYRVSIEGFKIENILADEVIELKERFDNADESTSEKVLTSGMPSTYKVRFWWD